MPDLAHEPVKKTETPAPDTSVAQPDLQPRGNDAAKDQVAAGGADTGLANYESALGEFLGKKLYGAVSGVLTYDKLHGQAKGAVTSALGALADSLGKIDNVDADPKALDNLGVMLDAAAAPAVEKLLEKYGPELTGKLAKWTGAHPKTVLTVALLAAAGAVIANAPIPELAKQFKLGKSITVDVEAKLGRLRQLALEKLKAKVSYAAGPLLASIEADNDGNVAGTVTAGTDDKKIALDAKFDGKGLKVVGLDGVLKPDENTTILGNIKQKRDEKLIGSLSLTHKDGSITTTNDFKYDANTGILGIGRTSLFEDSQYKLQSNVNGNSDGTGSAGMRVETKEGPLTGYGGVSHETTKGAYGLQESDKLQMGLAFKRSDLTAKLDAQLSTLAGDSKLSGSVDKKWGNNHAGASFSAVLDNPKLLEVGAFYGFKDPNEFKSFLVEYKHKGSTSENALSMVVENTLSDVRLRWQQNLTWGGDSDTKLNTKFHAAKFLNKDTALLGGAEHEYNFSTGKSNIIPQIGVQYKGLPVLVGYDQERKAVKIGITIPF
ncbi:hypothetical protein LBMAG42_16910 [Deltaproteobacteria bacterium]|nr:hypothetical protein LBMAG42_16910 [Deltaproteobacteria bacterium]